MDKTKNRTDSDNVKPTTKRYRRGEQTRELLLKATINCLHKNGYGGTTVESVMARTGVSRGSVLNQFANKVVLMAEAADESLRELISSGQRDLEALKSPEDRVLKYFDISWEQHRSPEATALTEILLASHWDGKLATAIRPLIERRETQIAETLVSLATHAGIENIDAYVISARLLNSNLRGLTVEFMFDPNRDTMLKCFAVLREDYHRLCERALGDN